MSEGGPHPRLDRDGQGWFAYAPGNEPPAGSHGQNDERSPRGPIRLMGDYGGAFLWERGGNIGGGEDDFEYLQRHLGLTRALCEELAKWGVDWDGASNTPGHDRRGRELLERLRAACPAYEFVLEL